MQKFPNYYKNRVCLNVLSSTVKNAQECYEAAEGNIVLGVLSKNYNSDALAIEDMKRYQELTDNALSIGLGAGDPNQSKMVTRIAGVLQPQHVNQVFSGSGASRGALGNDETVVNALISPTGKVGYVNISTGPLSSGKDAVEVSAEQAIFILKDMGASAVKFYPMNGLSCRDEYVALAEACAKYDFGLEPTGGITLDNFEEILKIAVDAGVPKIIPHIYSSIIDSASGETRVADVIELYEIVKRVLKDS